jgi:hypothetical protein
MRLLELRDTSADARGNLGLPCTTTSPKTFNARELLG